MGVVKRAGGYSKIENEDADETKSRRAQFLIYKSLQRADITRRRRSWLKVKMFKLKIKIGCRLLKKLKKGFCSTSTLLFSANHQIACLLKSCKHLLNGKQQPAGAKALHPIF